ncbi:MAG: type transport system permease protein [Frankiales bacterium]|jgi:ABC transporter DrrB family efflux protein|nr:type transport system permease protein [Frankiales bacterium]
MSLAAPAGSRIGYAVSDTLAMAGRNGRRMLRMPDQVVFTLVSPIMFTLLFRYVFGGAIGGLGDINYVNYLIPGIAVQTAIFASGTTGFALAEDRKAGFIDRLRSLPMARSAVLAGRVAADAVNNAVGLLIIVLVGLAVGFRPHSLLGLIFGFGVLLAFTVATSFMFGLLGLYASSAQAVNAMTFPVIFPLTFASSAFVPTATMPSWLRAFADHQPVTTVINTVRDLTLGTVGPAQRSQLFAGQSTTALVVQSLVWTVGIGLVFGFLAVRRYNSTSS